MDELWLWIVLESAFHFELIGIATCLSIQVREGELHEQHFHLHID